MAIMLPDKKGYFGIFGGKYVPETVMAALDELEKVYFRAKKDRKFQKQLHHYLCQYTGRPTPLYRALRLEKKAGGAKIYLKREDLDHTGAHKINNTIGQLLLAKMMGKTRIIAETGAGQHGVATATASALFGLQCDVYMGTEDIKRQALNVFRMELLGTRVLPVDSGSCTLKDAINEAMRDWTTNIKTTYYVIGSVVGPHPYPVIVRDFQTVIGKETRKQILKAEGRLPDYIIACVGGGSNSIGIFYPFRNDKVRLIGVEAAGLGLDGSRHGATLARGRIGILHGTMSYLLQDKNGQITETHSVAAGLDYPGIGPEHSYMKTTGRAEYVSATDREALSAFKLLSESEGIIPALESAHAVAYAVKLAPKLGRSRIIIINLSGRGDKDADIVSGKIK